MITGAAGILKVSYKTLLLENSFRYAPPSSPRDAIQFIIYRVRLAGFRLTERTRKTDARKPKGGKETILNTTGALNKINN